MVLIEDVKHDEKENILRIKFSVVDDDIDYAFILRTIISGYLGFDYMGEMPKLAPSCSIYLDIVYTDKVAVVKFSK